jgi:hypothetical protein
MSSATTWFANKKAMPPLMPGSRPRIGEEPLSAKCRGAAALGGNGVEVGAAIVAAAAAAVV